MRWRVGRKAGRTIYGQAGDGPSDKDRLIGVMDTESFARDAVEAHNAKSSEQPQIGGARLQPRSAVYDEFRRRLADDEDPAVVAEEAIAKGERFQQLWFDAEDRWRQGVTPWTAEIKRLRDLLAADETNVERMTEALILHYGENVMPVSKYCEGFQDWQKALVDLLADPDCTDYQRQIYEPVVKAMSQLWPLPIMKSNYLARRLYAGDPHRTVKCPVHKGHWSGCHPPGTEAGDCACEFQGNTTGWLPAETEAS